MSELDEHYNPVSDRWLDQPDWESQLEHKLDHGQVGEEDVERLRGFVEKGFAIIELGDIAGLAEQLQSDINRFWKEGPMDLAYRFVGDPRSMADAIERKERQSVCRILDPHSHSSAALSLYLHPEIFRWARMILGEQAIALRSAFKEFGSREALARDTAYFDLRRPAHLLGVYLALEDVDPNSGPLTVVSGSHRFPHFEFAPGRIVVDPDEDYREARVHARREAEKRNLKEEIVCCRKGEAIIWHAALVHGTDWVRDASLERRSLLIHYSTRTATPSRGVSFNRFHRVGRGRWEDWFYWRETDLLLEKAGCVGFENPLRNLDVWTADDRRSVPKPRRDWRRRFRHFLARA